MRAVNDGGRVEALAARLAQIDRMADLLPAFHDEALRAAGGRVSVLLRLNPRTGRLQADSAAGLEALDPAAWLDAPEARQWLDGVWSSGAATLTPAPELPGRLGTPHAAAVPLICGTERLGLLVVGADRAIDAGAPAALAPIGHLLAVALERARLRRGVELHRELRDLVATLTRSVSSLSLAASLEIFCDGASRLFAADRVSVWLHDRRARKLELTGSSDVAEIAARRILAADDPAVPVSAVMRRRQAEILASAGGAAPDIVAPLRGHRRALGVLELAGVRIDPGDAVDVLDRVEEVARQLSAAIETVWLLEDVIRSRRELESMFDALADLVVVCDSRLRVTQANRAFAERAGRSVSELAERPLDEILDREVVEWIASADATSPTRATSRELIDRRLNGTFSFTVTPLPGRDGELAGTVVVARDVGAAERLRTEDARQ